MKQLSLPLEMDEAGTNSITYVASVIEDTELPEYNIPEVEVVSVVLTRHKIVTVTGKVTGRKYIFRGAGSIVDDVDKRDAEIMINQPLPPSCCGSYPTPQFQILGR